MAGDAQTWLCPATATCRTMTVPIPVDRIKAGTLLDPFSQGPRYGLHVPDGRCHLRSRPSIVVAGLMQS